MRITYGAIAHPDLPIGYGVISKWLKKSLEKTGVEFVEDFDYDLSLVIGLPSPWLLGREPRPDMVFHTMYEAYPAPPQWVKVLNRVGAVWVPSKWVGDLFVSGGVTSPVLVSGYGVDTDFFRFAPRQPHDGPFRVLAWGRGLISRKNLIEAIRVFDRAGLPDAVMEVKVNVDDSVARDGPMQGMENVTVFRQDWKQAQLVQWLQSGDVLLYLSSGEGFGLMPLEAMATGLPVICTANTGMMDYLNPDVAIMVPCSDGREAPLYRARFQHHALTYFPDLDFAVDSLRHVYANREDAYAMGVRAAGYVRENWTWLQAGERAKALLSEYLQGV